MGMSEDVMGLGDIAWENEVVKGAEEIVKERGTEANAVDGW